MALIVEDGTGKTDSNTYADKTQARAYATARGVTLPADDSAVEAMLLKAADYLEGLRARYQGQRTTPGTQALQWPRSGVVIDDDYELPDNVIPVELKNAQCQLVLEQQSGLTLQPASDGRIVKSTKVDVIEKEYFSAADMGQSGSPLPTFPAVDALVAPLLKSGGTGLVSTVRA